MTVTRLKQEMSSSEYYGWIAYFNEKNRRQDAESGNLLAMNPEDIMGKLNGG